MLQSTSVAAFSVDRLQEVFGGGFIDRLKSDYVRLVIGILLALYIMYKVITVETNFKGKTGEKAVTKLALLVGLISGPGAFYLWWRGYSYVVSRFWRDEELRQPLFIGEPAPSNLWGVFTSASLPWIIAGAVLSFLAFVVTADEDDNLPTRLFAALSVFSALMIVNDLFF